MTDLSTLTTEQLEAELAKRKQEKDRVTQIALATELAKKNQLKSEVKTIVKINYSDLERFIKQVFGATLEFACVEEMSNDTDKEFCNIGCGPDAFRNCSDDDENVEDFLFGRKKDLDPRTASCLLEWLAVNNFVPKGDYLVGVSW